MFCKRNKFEYCRGQQLVTENKIKRVLKNLLKNSKLKINTKNSFVFYKKFHF